MPTSARSYAKINIGLVIGGARPDGFHELRTVYQTIGLYDTVRVEVRSGTGIELRSKDSRVPLDESNTCYRVAERFLRQLKRRAGKIIITIEKKLPVQGGMGAASSNAVATLLALERELKESIPPEEKLRIAAEVGSDLPLFTIGGTVLGVGRGEEVFPLPDLPALACVVATSPVAVSTPAAFKAWDDYIGCEAEDGPEHRRKPAEPASNKLTQAQCSDRITMFSRSVYQWLSVHLSQPQNGAGGPKTGVPRGQDRGDRAEALLLDLVRAGIENDFERVVFPKYPELREVKRALERHGAGFASLSGSGSTVYGLFASREQTVNAAEALQRDGTPAEVTTTLTRPEYWDGILAS